jgi:hypothetical protein
MRWWVVGLLFCVFGDRALAQESPVDTDLDVPEAVRAYDQAVIRFNTNVQAFPSWAAFQAEVLTKIAPGTSGTCYEISGSRMRTGKITQVPFQGMSGEGWEATSGNGWRQVKEDRTFIEYRINDKANLLVRLEGVKKFLFSQTKRLCEFPL